jgi:putative SOS response-associated peptidase YedK
MGKDLFDSNYNSKRGDLCRPRRMPVILDPDSYDLWLDPAMQNVAAISELLKPYDAASMRSHSVSTRINHVAHDDEECSRPVVLATSQSGLFA